LQAVIELDGRAFGAARPPLVKALYERAPKLAFGVEGQGRLRGFCLGRDGANFTQIGPVVAENPEVAWRLTRTAMSKLAGKPVVMDAPQAQEEFLDRLRSLGFVEQRELIRMYRGANRPGRPSAVFAIAGPEFG
jgi:hypothetical protein